MSEWRYHNPVEIHFGPGIIGNLPNFVSGKTVLVTTPGTTKRGISRKISKLLGASLVALFDKVAPNPTFETITAAYRELKQVEYDLIIAVGGGSVLDTAKAIVAIGASGSEDWIDDHLKRGAPFPDPFNPKPVIAIPTTAGTGSEVTMWATIWDMEEKKKYSLSHPKLYPEIALLDPELTLSLPKDVTVTTGLDALSHAFEAIWNRNSTPIATAYALKAISIVFQILPKLINALGSLEYRAKMMEASLLSGLAISQTRTALAHSMSYPITARFGVPHGIACSFTLPVLLDFNAQADDGRFAEVVERLGFASVQALRDGLIELLTTLRVDALLKKYISSIEDLVNLAPNMLTPGRADNNLRPANLDDVEMILKIAWRTIVFD